MVMVTNKAKGPRGFNVGKHDGADDKALKGKSIAQVVLMPGESRDIDLHDADHPVVKGMIDNGEIEVGDSKPDLSKAQPLKFNVEGLNEQELRAFIKDRTGKDADPRADKAALQGTARTLAAA